MSSAAVEIVPEGPEALSVDDLTQFHVASEIVNRTLEKIIIECVAGKRVVELCEGGDQCMRDELNSVFKAKEVEKGIAFPTCLSINNCVSNYSPLSTDTLVLSVGDVVKIELSAHINGHIASVCHTHVVNPTLDQPLIGKSADVICAAYMASEVAMRMLKPGNSSYAMTKGIEMVAKAFDCQPVLGVESCNTKKFVIDGNRIIPNKAIADSPAEDFEFEVNEIYNIDVSMTTGEGKPRAMDVKSTIYRRDVNAHYQLKLKNSRQFMADVIKNTPVMPFTLRAHGNDVRASMAATECARNELLLSYPVLFERAGHTVARFKFTMLLLPTGPVRLTGATTLPYVHSEKSISDAELNKLMETAVTTKVGQAPKKAK
eukprot:Ihof_evm8s80 gene=Ihof_evmTU8s80